MNKAKMILFTAVVLTTSAGAVPGRERVLSFLDTRASTTRIRSSEEAEVQQQIDGAMSEIMATQLGSAICIKILHADKELIEQHLGVSEAAAEAIAKRCAGGFASSSWVESTPKGQIEKFSVDGSQKRHYLFVQNGDSLPFDSWTEPFSNTTVFVIHAKRDKPINRQRLLQLLAHETAVYFDSKSQLGHQDANYLKQLSELRFSKSSTGFKPTTAVMNPIIAHTLTFVRALRVEREIVGELVSRGYMAWPEEYKDPLIADLLSNQCLHKCLERVIKEMSDIYLPLSLPLVAFSPTYRLQKLYEQSFLKKADERKWLAISFTLDRYPQAYIDSIDLVNHKPFMELIDIFASQEINPNFLQVENTFRRHLWPEDWETVCSTRLENQPYSLLEFMKIPLLSGYNISFSNGPRVRIRAGGAL